MRKAEIICEFQPYMDQAPSRQALMGQATANDGITVSAWKKTWIANVKANHAKFGPFKDRGLGKLHGKHKLSPAIVIGSGPSLKGNAAGLKANPGIPTISCLHNFHFLEDLGVGADYYVSLDSGEITVEEVSEGGSRTPDEYWAMTKGKTLLAYIGSHPRLLEMWQGEIYFFSAALPDQEVMKAFDEIEKFHTYVSTGGNVLGASTYIAKAFFGCNPIALMGADFCFSYLHKFHGWDSKYDANIGNCIRMTDVYGNSVRSWQSYANFKAWFDWVSMTVPGTWINCTEGGTFGAYPGGNIRTVQQMELLQFFKTYTYFEEMREQSENPETPNMKILF